MEKQKKQKTKRTKYHYVVSYYNSINKYGAEKTSIMTFTCKTTDEAGIPTKGYITKASRNAAEKAGNKFVEGSVVVVSIMELTKAQYDNLMDETEPEEIK